MSISTLYEQARDVNGNNHCYIRWFNPSQRIEIVFPGYNGEANKQTFLDRYGLEVPVTGRVDVSEPQLLIIHF